VEAYQEDLLVRKFVAGVWDVLQVQEELAEDDLELVTEGRAKSLFLGGLECG